MKFPSEKTRQQYQNLLDRQVKLKSELREFQNQIQQFESTYFEKYWNEGNVVLGWPKVIIPPPPSNAPKIKLVAKDKPFSLSSVTSKVNYDLQDIQDKNLMPLPENRFQAKRTKNKKGKEGVETRKKFIRRRRR